MGSNAASDRDLRFLPPCTCDPGAFETGPEGQRRYFEDRYCPLHGEEAQRTAACHPFSNDREKWAYGSGPGSLEP